MSRARDSGGRGDRLAPVPPLAVEPELAQLEGCTVEALRERLARERPLATAAAREAVRRSISVEALLDLRGRRLSVPDPDPETARDAPESRPP